MKKCADKKCKSEGEPQPLENFYKTKSSKDGYVCYCKDCDNRRSANRYKKKGKSEHWLKILIG